jgi:hypothetical protein
MGDNVMHLWGIFTGAAACVVLALGVAVRPAAAESGPPISVSGFSYRATGGMHAHICNRPSCGGGGSVVSYVFYPPNPIPTFQAYKSQRIRLEQELRARLAPGVTVKFKPPTQKKDKLFSIFESWRTISAPGRSPQVTVSRTIVAKAMIIELISSAEQEKTAEVNLALFTLPAMAMAMSDSKTRLRMESRD